MASDVWSFGVVAWELYSYGERPYWDWANQVVLNMLERGYRLPAPAYCPKQVYKIIRECWASNPDNRPTFSSIIKNLGLLASNQTDLESMAAQHWEPSDEEHYSNHDSNAELSPTGMTTTNSSTMQLLNGTNEPGLLHRKVLEGSKAFQTSNFWNLLNGQSKHKLKMLHNSMTFCDNKHSRFKSKQPPSYVNGEQPFTLPRSSYRSTTGLYSTADRSSFY